MDRTDRGRIAAKNLIELIIQAPDPEREVDLKMANFELLVQGLKGQIEHVLDTATRNKEDIAVLQVKNNELARKNVELRTSVDDLNKQLEENDDAAALGIECNRKIHELRFIKSNSICV